MRYLLFWLSVLVSCTVMWAEAVAQPARQDRLDEASLTAAASNLWETISQAVSQVGGDLERQHLHLVLAFSTGHFNKDPMAAQAAKQVAWHVVREYLIAGDRVSCYAWEMDLWEHLPPGQQYTVTLTDSSDEGKKFIQDLFPQTVQDGSLGGHDTERAIVQIVRRLGDARDAVIVLLTNDAQSVAPRGMQTIGTDNPSYQQVLQSWKRLPQRNERGASEEVIYRVIRPSGEEVSHRLDVVILVPTQFDANQIAEGTRSANIDKLLLPQAPVAQDGSAEVPDEQPEPSVQSPRARVPMGLLVFIAIAGLLAVVVWYTMKQLQGEIPDLTVVGTPISFSQAGNNALLCTLVGKGYAEPVEHPVEVKDAPPVRIAQLRKSGKNRIRVESGDFTLARIGDAPPPQQAELVPGNEYRLVFAGDVPQVSGPSLRTELVVHIDWRRRKNEEGH